ncbi:MAG: DUF3102 domain-containing protein [Syntrophus sp. (in: bacteria)]
MDDLVMVEENEKVPMETILNMQHFDYSLIEEHDRDFLIGKEVSIKQRTSQTIIENGRDLLEAKARVGHDNFLVWLAGCFPWSQRTAYNMMQVAENIKVATVATLENIQLKALYLLAAPSTPESAREEAISRAEDGEKLTHAQVKELVDAKKAIAGLENKISSLESQLPSEAVLSQIEKLKADLEAALTKPTKLIIEQEQALAETNEVNRRLQDQIETLEQTLSAAATKPAEVKIVEKVVEKIPGDYESLKEQRDALNVEIVTLQKKIKSITKTHNDEVDFKVNAKVNELRGTIAEREHHLEEVKGEIAKLYVVRRQLDSEVGDIAASQDTCKIVRQHLLEIALALHDLLDDHSVHPDCADDIEDLCAEMEKGAEDFRLYLNRRHKDKTTDDNIIDVGNDGLAIIPVLA